MLMFEMQNSQSLTAHALADMLVMLWSDRTHTSLEDDLNEFRSIDLPDAEHFQEALFGMCKSKCIAA